MAYAPDDAIPRLGELSASAIQLYLFHCRWRDHTDKVSRATLAQAMQELKMKRATAYRADLELRKKGFTREVESGALVLLVGDFSRMDEWAARRRKKKLAEEARKRQETGLNAEAGSLNFETKNLNSEARNLKNETAINKDRSSPSIQPSYPADHPAPTPPTPAPKPAQANRVGVGSIYEFDQVLAWAQDEARRDPAIRSARAVAEARYRDGAADTRIGQFLAPKQPELPNPLLGIDVHLCPDCHGSGMEIVPGNGARRCTHPRLLATWIAKQQEAAAEGEPERP